MFLGRVCLKLLRSVHKAGLQGCKINPLLVYGDLFGFRGAVTCILLKSCSGKKRALFWRLGLLTVGLLTQFFLLYFSLCPLCPLLTAMQAKAGINWIR